MKLPAALKDPSLTTSLYSVALCRFLKRMVKPREKTRRTKNAVVVIVVIVVVVVVVVVVHNAYVVSAATVVSLVVPCIAFCVAVVGVNVAVAV